MIQLKNIQYSHLIESITSFFSVYNSRKNSFRWFNQLGALQTPVCQLRVKIRIKNRILLWKFDKKNPLRGCDISQSSLSSQILCISNENANKPPSRYSITSIDTKKQKIKNKNYVNEWNREKDIEIVRWKQSDVFSFLVPAFLHFAPHAMVRIGQASV